MQKINLTKYGFVRDEAQDFSDDGTRFYVYKVGKRVRVSKATWKGEVFLSARIDGNILSYDEYSKLPYYKDLDRLNGVYISSLTDNDLFNLYTACLEYEKAYDEAEKNVNFPTIDELKARCEEIRAIRADEYNKAEDLIAHNALKIIKNMPSYRLDTIKKYLEALKKKALGFDPDNYPQSIQKSQYGRTFASDKCYDLRPSYEYETIVNYINELA